MEGVITVCSDTVYFQNTPKWKIVGIFCSVGFLCSLLYATDAGLNWLDVIDVSTDVVFPSTVTPIVETLTFIFLPPLPQYYINFGMYCGGDYFIFAKSILFPSSCGHL